MPIQFLPPGHPTSGELLQIQKYKEWLEDPRYIRVVPLISNYAAAIMVGKIELRRLCKTVRYSGLINEWVPVKTYTVNDNQSIDDWMFIYHGYDQKENEVWNDELRHGCISAYRETMKNAEDGNKS